MNKLNGQILLLIALILSSQSFAQQSEKNSYRGSNLVLEAGGFIGVDKFRHNGISPVTFVGGYTFSEHLFIGGGVTMNYSTKYEFVSLPIFARIKGTLLKSKISPYLSIDIGYDATAGGVDYNINPDWQPTSDIVIYRLHNWGMGFHFRPEVGVLIRLKERKAIHIGVGYMEQRGYFTRTQYTITNDGVQEDYRSSDLIGGFTIRAGFTF